MKLRVIWLVVLFTLPLFAAAQPATWRIDLLHSQHQGAERFQVQALWQEPQPWLGPINYIDSLNRGDYRFELRAIKSGEVLFAQSYSSLFADWSLSVEAENAEVHFQEVLRFPAPALPSKLLIYKRRITEPDQPFALIWQVDLPNTVVMAQVSRQEQHRTLHAATDPSQSYGLVILAEGFQAAEQEAFFSAAAELSDSLLQHAPFAQLKDYLTISAIMTHSAQSGLNTSDTKTATTRFAVNPNSYDMPRYALSMAVFEINNAAMAVPYNSVVLLTNSADYHGSGIFRTYAVAPAFHPRREFLLLHELGHSIAGLADEYFHATPGYAGSRGTIEPYQPNITTKAGLSELKWQTFVTERVVIPTPWPQQSFIEKPDIRTLQQALHFGTVGAFQGANYSAEHYYRPAMACLMLMDMGDNHFCPVCQHAVAEQIGAELGWPAPFLPPE